MLFYLIVQPSIGQRLSLTSETRTSRAPFQSLPTSQCFSKAGLGRKHTRRLGGMAHAQSLQRLPCKTALSTSAGEPSVVPIHIMYESTSRVTWSARLGREGSDEARCFVSIEIIVVNGRRVTSGSQEQVWQDKNKTSVRHSANLQHATDVLHFIPFQDLCATSNSESYGSWLCVFLGKSQVLLPNLGQMTDCAPVARSQR